MTGRALIAAHMSEDRGPDSLDAHVRRLIKDLGLWGYHPHDSRKSREGWPDWVIMADRPSGEGWVMFRELKAERGRLTPAQLRVGGMLAKAGQDWDVWRPSDLISGLIGKELALLAGLGERQ